MNDFILKKSQLLWFPCTLGLTGKAFNEGYISYNNLVEKKTDGNEDPIDERFIKTRKLRVAQHEFMKDIDNAMGAKDIENYLIGAIRDSHGYPNGIIQMFNFGPSPVTRVELDRFHALAGFLGGCVENVSELLKTLQTLFGLQIEMKGGSNMVEDAFQISYQKLSGMRELDIPVSMIKK
jgi:hypothetical protein